MAMVVFICHKLPDSHYIILFLVYKLFCMSRIDWIVLVGTLTGIIAYGLYKSRTSKNLEGYFLSNRSLPWYLVLLSIMGTQASAITFLSAPGQAFTDGMRFVQYYFGLPLAMVILCITFVPLYSRLKVFTAYEFLEKRFDSRTRTFTSFLFLLSRGLSTGVSIYAPSIILSSLLGWDIFWTNIVMGGLLIIYTVSGGAKAVAYTQKIQMVIIFGGMFSAGYCMMHYLPSGIGFKQALQLSGAGGKLNVITTGFTKNGFDWKDRYNIVSGVIGGFFLALSYFGSDQSQVGRYLAAKDSTESKVGLLMNGLVKVPMQFFILLLGAMLFAFYQFNAAPIFFNKALADKGKTTVYQSKLITLENDYYKQQLLQQNNSKAYLLNIHDVELKAKLKIEATKLTEIQKEYKTTLKKALPTADTNDTNYIFLRFVIDFLPKGIVGLLIAIIFMSAWGSIAAALNALASCTMIDFHKRIKKDYSRFENQNAISSYEYKTSKLYTLAWGIFSIITAELSSGIGSLIEAVNILGSLFYGVILGIFLVGFYLKRVEGKSVFYGAIISEIIIVVLFALDKYEIIGLGFLWLNVIGALLVLLISSVLEILFRKSL